MPSVDHRHGLEHSHVGLHRLCGTVNRQQSGLRAAGKVIAMIKSHLVEVSQGAFVTQQTSPMGGSHFATHTTSPPAAAPSLFLFLLVVLQVENVLHTNSSLRTGLK
jgi:hypothetical protein